MNAEVVAKVAEALWRADVGADLDELYPWDSLDSETTGAHYLRMAKAAIDVLHPLRVYCTWCGGAFPSGHDCGRKATS